MLIKSLYLDHFRLYKDTLFEFSEGINAIYGSNAQGKTTILEAIFFLMMGKSFRAFQSKDLISYNQPHFYLDVVFEKNKVQQRIKAFFSDKQKKIFFNQTLCPSLSSLLGLIQGVIILPDDLELIKGGPQSRRQFLDVQIAQVDPLYIHHLMRYQRAMKQRNTLLKAQKFNAINCWESEMAVSAAYLTKTRAKVVQEIALLTQKHFNYLFPSSGKIELFLKTSTGQIENCDALFFSTLYAQSRKKDALLGTTSHGPQKDDVLILLDQREMKFFASEGQQRGCAISLRFAEWERMSKITESHPLMLVDDIGLNLDETRKILFYELLTRLGQCFTTSTHKPIGLCNVKDKEFLITSQSPS